MKYSHEKQQSPNIRAKVNVKTTKVKILTIEKGLKAFSKDIILKVCANLSCKVIK